MQSVLEYFDVIEYKILVTDIDDKHMIYDTDVLKN